MKMKYLRLVAVLLIGGIFLSGCGERRKGVKDVRDVASPRIVSLSPVTTEALFALGLGQHIVGVSDKCDFPAEASTFPVATGKGGVVDAERIARLKPDFVVAANLPDSVFAALSQRNMEVMNFSTASLNGIIKSMWILGEDFQRADVVTAWLEGLNDVLRYFKARAPQGGERPKVMICCAYRKKDIMIAGRGSLYGEILAQVGGDNVYQGNAHFAYVQLDGVLTLNPDIIIDIVPSTMAKDDAEKVRKRWKKLSTLNAVKNDRVFVLDETWATRPGPRVGFLIERFGQIVQD